MKSTSPRDIGPAAKAFPGVRFIVYHSGYERNPDGQEGALREDSPEGVDRLIMSARAAGIGHGGNIYCELGSTWFMMLRRPVEAAHIMGKLLKQFGAERILWGTDSTWYGSPQSLIDAFRAFVIPEDMQEKFGYPALTPEIKDMILIVMRRRSTASISTMSRGGCPACRRIGPHAPHPHCTQRSMQAGSGARWSSPDGHL